MKLDDIIKKSILGLTALAGTASGAIIDGHFSTEYDGQMPDGTHLWNTTVVNTTQSDSSDYSAWKLEFPVKIDDSMMPYADKPSWGVGVNNYENNAEDPADNYFAIDTNDSGEYLVPALDFGANFGKDEITVTYTTSFGPDPSLEQTWEDFAKYDAQLEMFTRSAGSNEISGKEDTSGTDYGYLPSDTVIPEPNTIILMLLGGATAAGRRNYKRNSQNADDPDNTEYPITSGTSMDDTNTITQTFDFSESYSGEMVDPATQPVDEEALEVRAITGLDPDSDHTRKQYLDEMKKGWLEEMELVEKY